MGQNLPIGALNVFCQLDAIKIIFSSFGNIEMIKHNDQVKWGLVYLLLIFETNLYDVQNEMKSYIL